MKPSSSYMIELNRMADVIFAISSNLDPEGNTPVQKPKTKQEKIREIRYYQGKLPGKRLICENKGGELAVTVETDAQCITGLCLEGPAEIIKEYEL